MTSMKLRSLSTAAKCALIALLVLGSAVTSLAFVDARSDSERARDWARDNVATLPTARALITYPLAFRREAFKVMTPEARSEAAQTFLSWYESSHKLTTEQAALVRDMRSLMTPAAYSDGFRSPETMEALKTICSRIKEAFPDPAQRDSFATFGRQADSDVSSVRRLAGFVQKTFGSGVAYATPRLDPCDCSSDTWCTSCQKCDGACQNNGGIGCGCGFIWNCDKLCTQF